MNVRSMIWEVIIDRAILLRSRGTKDACIKLIVSAGEKEEWIWEKSDVTCI